MIFQALPIVEQSDYSIDYRLQYQEHSKIFDEKLSSPLLSFLNGTIHFCLHHSMHFLILREKVSRYLDRKIISLEDILTLISPNLSYEEEEETA